MMTIKRTAVIIFMIFFILMSAFDCRYFSYATDNWEDVTTNAELVEAFIDYCKSRDLTIEGSIADGVTSFTTQTFNGICNAIGIDVTALQAHIKKSTDGNNVKYLFDSTGITAYNQIFAQFLQDNELEVGDSVNDTVYSGKTFKDNDGNVVNCTILNNNLSLNNSAVNTYYDTSVIIAVGSVYIDSGDSLYNAYGLPSNTTTTNAVNIKTTNYNVLSNKSYTYTFYQVFKNSGSPTFNAITFHQSYNATFGQTLYGTRNGSTLNGYVTVFYNVVNDWYNVGSIVKNGSGYSISMPNTGFTLPSGSTASSNLNIVLTSNNTVINNNTYEGDTIINNEGDIINDSHDTIINPLPPDNPYDDPDPTQTTPDGDDWDIDMPDLDINWILTGKEKKFPFDIPFNVMFALSLLNAEPEAPHLEGTLDFGFTEWDYELSLEQFDDVAETCRNFEFLAFLIGLMLMTKKLIWG